MAGRLVLCTCKSHCTTFDSTTQTFVGPGCSIPKSTALAHQKDDLRVEHLESFSENVASRILEHDSPPATLDTRLPTSSQHELFALETEVIDRMAWTPTDQALAFAVDPSPESEYQYPSFSEIHLANHGPHALDPSKRSNALYLENESRLCEILSRLKVLASTSDEAAGVEDKVYEGLRRMRRHKETEWNRLRRHSIVRRHGYPVVDCSKSSMALRLSPYLIQIKAPTYDLLSLMTRLSRRHSSRPSYFSSSSESPVGQQDF